MDQALYFCSPFPAAELLWGCCTDYIPLVFWYWLKERHYCPQAANSTSSTQRVRAANGNEPLARQNNIRSHLATSLSQLLHEFSFPNGISVCNSRNRGANVQKTNPVTENSSHMGCCHFPSLTCVSHSTGQNLFLFALESLGEFLLNPWMALCSAESRSDHGSTLEPAVSSTPFSICSSPGRQHQGERQHRLTAPTCVSQQCL